MEHFWRFLESDAMRGTAFTPESVVLSLLLAFVLGQALAWVYHGTYTGLSYSSSFVQSLILIAVAVALVMAVIGTSIITAFGLMGALALVRFRNVIKDTRDVVFVFAALVIGMAAGAQRHAVAILGTGVLCALAVYLRLTAFGSHQAHNAFLRFSLPGSWDTDSPVPRVLQRFCISFALVSARRDGGAAATEYAYQVTVRDARRNDDLLAELAGTVGTTNVSLIMQEELLEV